MSLCVGLMSCVLLAKIFVITYYIWCDLLSYFIKWKQHEDFHTTRKTAALSLKADSIL